MFIHLHLHLHLHCSVPFHTGILCPFARMHICIYDASWRAWREAIFVWGIYACMELDGIQTYFM